MAQYGLKTQEEELPKKTMAVLNILNTMPRFERSNLCAMNSVEMQPNQKWETLAAIVDSGASVPVFNPSTASTYELQEPDSSKAGDEYEIANGDELPNFGEKFMPVVIAEGSWKGMAAQVADVSKALQSARSLVKAGHVVVFGDGEDGSQNYIVNNVTGEQTTVKDNGINYFLELHIAPRSEVGFARPER